MKESVNKPHAYNGTFYIRRGASDRKMPTSEVIKMAEKKGIINFDTILCDDFDYQRDFDADKFFQFLKEADLELPDKNDILPALKSLRVVNTGKTKRSKLVFNNTGVLFFAKDLGKIFRHTEISCALYRGKEKTKIIDVIQLNSYLLSSVDGAMKSSRRCPVHCS